MLFYTSCQKDIQADKFAKIQYYVSRGLPENMTRDLWDKNIWEPRMHINGDMRCTPHTMSNNETCSWLRKYIKSKVVLFMDASRSKQCKVCMASDMGKGTGREHQFRESSAYLNN
ncbi:hypothetical protein TNCV_3823841 [Trichonephila clavipes]|nr:hypothetical protein TNCV_3823841 [Trichonephila clavipes]